MTTISVKSIFDTMSYPETLTGNDLYVNWLSKRPYKEYSCFIKNAYQDKSHFDTQPDPLCLEDARNAVNSSPWNDPISRSTLLLKLSQAVEKQKNLFACVESGSTRKPLTRTNERDVPELVVQLSNAAQAVSNCPDNWKPHGVVGILMEDTNSPSLSQSLQLGPVLAAGNAVVLCASLQNCLTAFLMAETARDVGFPANILSVVCEVSSYIINSFDLVVGSGLQPPENHSSRLKWKQIARPKAIVTETADLASAAQGIVQLAFFNAPNSPTSGACVLVQENIYDMFWTEIQSVFERLRPLTCVFSDNGDFYCEISLTNHSGIREKNINDAIAEGAEVIIPQSKNLTNMYATLVLVRRIRSSAPLLEDQTLAGSQIVWIQSFRHLKEAVTLANGFPFTNHVSIWGEQASVLLDIAKEVRASSIWINTQNIIGAAGDLDTSVFLCKTEPKKTTNISASAETSFDRVQFAKDVKGAVSSARGALKKWAGLGAHDQFQLMFSLASNIRSHEEALKQVAQPSCFSKDIELFHKIASKTVISALRLKSSSTTTAKCWSWTYPHGVVGVVLPSNGTFLSLLISIGTALAAGNAVVIVLHSKALGDLCQKIFSTSGIPPGMISFLVADDASDGPAEVLLGEDINAAWILTSHSNLYVNRPDLTRGTLPISYLDLSDYDWENHSCHGSLCEWFEKQATSIKKIWFACGGSV